VTVFISSENAYSLIFYGLCNNKITVVMKMVSTQATPLEAGEGVDVNVHHLQAHVSVQLSCVSEQDSTRFGLVDTKCAPMGVCRGFLFTAQA
jgi:hypothetical protein